MRYTSLDSLRGVAALIVVFSHFAQVYFNSSAPGWIRYTPLRLLIDGKASVLVFFALSGFVLFLTLIRRDHFRYWPYIVKRFFRLYPPFAAAIVASAVLYWLVRPVDVPALGAWFNRSSWTVAPNVGLIVAHLAMTDKEAWRTLDNVMWSLGHEARISLVFPLLALWVYKSWRTACIVFVGVALASRFVVVHHPVSWLYDPFQTSQYLFLFAGGAAVALNAGEIRERFAKIRLPARVTLWAGASAVTLCQIPAVEIVGECGAILLIALCFADPIAVRILSRGPFVGLGRISYSLYLLHVPIFIALLHLLYGRMPLLAILAVTLVLVIAISDLSYRLVERPSMALGRRLAKLLEGASVPRPSAQGTRVGN